MARPLANAAKRAGRRSVDPITVLPWSLPMPRFFRYVRDISPWCDAAPASARPMPSSTERLPRCATSFGMSARLVPLTKAAT
jgi:hypothetical protein